MENSTCVPTIVEFKVNFIFASISRFFSNYVRQHCGLTICWYFCWDWEIRNHKQIQIIIGQWDEQACLNMFRSVNKLQSVSQICGSQTQCNPFLLWILLRFILCLLNCRIAPSFQCRYFDCDQLRNLKFQRIWIL